MEVSQLRRLTTTPAPQSDLPKQQHRQFHSETMRTYEVARIKVSPFMLNEIHNHVHAYSYIHVYTCIYNLFAYTKRAWIVVHGIHCGYVYTYMYIVWICTYMYMYVLVYPEISSAMSIRYMCGCTCTCSSGYANFKGTATRIFPVFQ